MDDYRFVVTVDVKDNSLSGAYSKLLKRMNANDWESTDEAYGADGEPVGVIEFAKIRSRVLDKMDAINDMRG